MIKTKPRQICGHPRSQAVKHFISRLMQATDNMTADFGMVPAEPTFYRVK
ncbi:hypothetical protein WH297_04865 [Ochrobactrum vermis]|uniref:Transposase n=1 Tax=Ochrobactrum vermis TaxID=1827297 RepID=A0ABU8P9Y2_9HYPH|nr:hypothetical protein [Ochrobactrum vermis]